MSQSTEPNPPLKPTETRAAFRFSVLNALSATVAAVATIWVGYMAQIISRQQVDISKQQKAFDLAATLAPLLVEAQATEKTILALKMLTAYSVISNGALPNDLLGVALVNYSSTDDPKPIEVQLRQMSTCVLHDAFEELANGSYDSDIRKRAKEILVTAPISYVCQNGLAVDAPVPAPSAPPPSASVSPPTSAVPMPAPAPPPAAVAGPAMSPAPVAGPAPSPTPTLVQGGGYSVIVASEHDQKAVQVEVNRVNTRLHAANAGVEAYFRRPARLPCWWSIDVGSNLPEGDARERLRAVRAAGYKDAYVTQSRSQADARAACPNDWEDQPQ